MESAAKTIWLIGETDTDERRRRCFGFIEDERGWQDHFDKIETATLAARTDELVGADRAEFEKHPTLPEAGQADNGPAEGDAASPAEVHDDGQ
jgi:hypothetical protein